MKITVDASKKCGTIKPVHGVGQPPLPGVNFSMIHFLTEAGIPFSRLHDVTCGFNGLRHMVDIPEIFPDFDADPADPASYDFAFTDLLIKELVAANVEPFFRLGVSIENYCRVKRYFTFPPKDNLQWARICEGIIRHYTEGWADGFCFTIRYWEIWNEPDGHYDPDQNQMWYGTMEQYFELYRTASTYLKEKFPQLKIGGYASCGFYALTCGGEDPHHQYLIRFFEQFLDFCQQNRCPLDFFSWHNYNSMRGIAVMADYARQKLDEYGFTDTETSLNEWNMFFDKRGTAEHTAANAAVLLLMQDLPIDTAMFYDAGVGVSRYRGLFDSMTREPLPLYDAFAMFNELYRRQTQVAVVSDDPDTYAVAAAKDGDILLMLANPTNDEKPLNVSFGDAKIVACRRIVEDRRAEDCAMPATLPPQSVLMITARGNT